MKLIVAGNVRQFQRYCQEQGLSPDEAKYVSRPDHLCGLLDPEIIFVGSWWKNPAASEARHCELRKVNN